jgi:predicted RNase H-like nuclease (RuvC/YqgF family)
MFRKLHIGILCAVLTLNACTDPTETEEYKQLDQAKAGSDALVVEKDSVINDLFASFNRISDNLNTIREKEGRIKGPSSNTEGGLNMEEKIMGDLQSIEALMAENRSLIAKLQQDAKGSASKLKKVNARVAELEKFVVNLERMVAAKDTEIVALREELASTNASLASMMQLYRDKEQLANQQQEDLNTAYYAVGSSKELQENGVLSKEGGVAGIGAVKKLNTASLNKEYFKRINITQMGEIPIVAKKVRLATSHPAGSYELVGAVEKLVIKDPAAFWSLSKYLVIVVD